MAMLKFLKGNYSSLNNAAVAEGQILITKDTREIFVDVDASTRIKIGDFITVANMAALPAATSVPTSRLYYVEDGNILARSNGTDWVQVNKQKTAEEMKTFLGLGSMAYVSSVTEDHLDANLKNKIGSFATTEQLDTHANTAASTYETKTDAAAKLTAANGYTDTEVKKVQDALDELDAYVGDIPEGYTAETIVAYINKKAEETLASAQGGSSETAASVKAALDTYKTENNAAVKANTDAIDAIEADYLKAADKTELQDSIDEKATKTDLNGAVERIAALENANKEGGSVASAIAGAQSTADQAVLDAKAAQDDIDALELAVGTPAEGKTIVQMIADAQTAATYDDEEIRGLISDNAYAIAAEKERAEGVEESLQNQINTIMNNPDAEGAINSINEFTKYVSDHGTIAEGFRTDIDKNKEDIAANAKAIADQATADAAKYETKTDASAKLTEAKEHATGLNDAMAVRVKALEDSKDAYIAADEEVLSEANEYADGLNSAMNTRVEALEAIDHKHDNEAELKLIATGDKAKWDAAAEKAHTHSFVESELNLIKSGDVAKWNAAESNAKDHADDLNTAMNTRVEAIETASATHALKTDVEAVQTALNEYKESNDDAIDLKANAADVYVKTETYTQDEVDDAIAAAVAAATEWGSF